MTSGEYHYYYYYYYYYFIFIFFANQNMSLGKCHSLAGRQDCTTCVE